MRYGLLICLLSFFHSLFAQQFNFSHIGTDKGIPSSEVYCVLQDSKGYMWFGTNSGVCRYNGKEYTTYTTAQGLTDNTVFAMCEDKAGRIWFGPQNNEICYWEKDSIYQVPASKMLRKALRSGSVYILTLYADSKNNIWISTRDGLYVSERETHYSNLKAEVKNVQSHMLLKVVDKKKVLVASQPMVRGTNPFWSIAYETQTSLIKKRILATKLLTNPPIPRTILLKDGRILFGLGQYLFTFYPDGRVETKSFNKIIISLHSDRDHGLWIGFFKGGLLYYKNQNLNATPVSGLEKYSVSCVYKDHEGGVWATTVDHGIFYTPSLNIFVYPHVPELEDHVIFLGALNNKIVVSTFGNGIFEIDSMLSLKPSADLGKIRDDLERLTTFKLIRDTLYIAFGTKLLIRDKSLKPIKKWGISVYNYAHTKDLVTGADLRIWTLHGGGLILLGKDRHLQDKRFATPFRLTCAIAEKDSGLYIGSKSGLYLLKNDRFFSMADMDPLLKNQVIQMKRDLQGNIWIATIGAGVLVLRNNKVVKQISRKDGLISDICNAIEIDRYNNVWVGTPNGLSCIKKAGRGLHVSGIKNIRQRNGLLMDEVTVLHAHNNMLWVGTMNGVCGIDIKHITSSPPPSPIYLKSVQVNNTLGSVHKSVFPYNRNNFRFTLEGLTFSDAANRRYRYRLQGFDNTWKERRTEYIEFNNLSPGNYTFYAAVANADGKWSKQPVVFQFTIENPFWKRWWFILLEIAFLALAIHLVIRFRTRIITKREEEKTRINTLLAEYQMKALRAQMNPHFIFNAINSIQNFILQRDSMQAYSYLTKFSQLIRFVLINTQENEMTLKQEIEILSLYVELEKLRFENAFEYTLHVDEAIDTEQVVIPALLIQPYVENAIWHGLMPLRDRRGVLAISIRAELEMLKITIKDNGLGRERSSKIKKKAGHQSMGMDLNQKRVEILGRGAEAARISVLDLYTENGEPGGTSVEITLPMIESY